MNIGAERNILDNNSMSFDERKKQLEEEKKQIEEDNRQAKKSPYTNFVQFNKDYYKAEDWLMSKSPIAYRIFKFLTNNMDDYNAVVCSYKVLEETFNVSQATIARAIKILKEKGYVAVYKSGRANIYALNDNIVWNSWGTNYPYSKFPANIILSISEQEQSIQTRLKTVKHKEVTINENNIRNRK